MMDPKELDLTYDKEFLPQSHFWGRLTLWVAVALCLMPPVYLSFVLGYHPGWPIVLAGFVAIVSTSGAYYIVEPVSYFPILGIAGTYMSFLAGNIANMRLPCAAAAQTAIEAPQGSKKAEMAGILGIAASVLVNLLTLTILVLVGTALVARFPPAVTKSFGYVLAGVFGAMFIQFAIRGPIYAVLALPVGIALNYATPLPPYVRIPISVFYAVFAATQYYKRTKKA
jgi:hypothetical protein